MVKSPKKRAPAQRPRGWKTPTFVCRSLIYTSLILTGLGFTFSLWSALWPNRMPLVYVGLALPVVVSGLTLGYRLRNVEKALGRDEAMPTARRNAYLERAGWSGGMVNAESVTTVVETLKRRLAMELAFPAFIMAFVLPTLVWCGASHILGALDGLAGGCLLLAVVILGRLWMCPSRAKFGLNSHFLQRLMRF